jgi:hypothetical protein
MVGQPLPRALGSEIRRLPVQGKAQFSSENVNRHCRIVAYLAPTINQITDGREAAIRS